MRRYETIYILRPSLNEEEINKVIENTNQIILDEEGTIIELNKWGMKKLAYLIKKETQGFFIYCDYAGNPKAVSEIERKFRIDDSVLRYMTIKTAESISDEQIQKAVGDVSAREIAANEPEIVEEEIPNSESDAAVNVEDNSESTKKTEE